MNAPTIQGPVITKIDPKTTQNYRSLLFRPNGLKPYDSLLSTFLFETPMRRCPKCSHLIRHKFSNGGHIKCDFCGLMFCPLCYTDYNGGCFHDCSKYPGKMPNGFSVCSYFILAIILIPLVPLVTLAPQAYALKYAFMAIYEDDYDSSVCGANLAALLYCDGIRGYLDRGCLEDKPVLTLLVVLILVFVIWLPIVLILSVIPSVLLLIIGTPYIWAVLVRYLLTVLYRILTL